MDGLAEMSPGEEPTMSRPSTKQAQEAADLLWRASEQIKAFVFEYLDSRRPGFKYKLTWHLFVGPVDRLQNGPGRFSMAFRLNSATGENIRQVVFLDSDIDQPDTPETRAALEHLMGGEGAISA